MASTREEAHDRSIAAVRQLRLARRRLQAGRHQGEGLEPRRAARAEGPAADVHLQSLPLRARGGRQARRGRRASCTTSASGWRRSARTTPRPIPRTATTDWAPSPAQHHLPSPICTTSTRASRAPTARSARPTSSASTPSWLQYRGRLDDSGRQPRTPPPGASFYEAMRQVAATGQGPREQFPPSAARSSGRRRDRRPSHRHERPLPAVHPGGAVPRARRRALPPLAGGPLWFDRGAELAAASLPDRRCPPPRCRGALAAEAERGARGRGRARAALDRPRLMGVLNVTPGQLLRRRARTCGPPRRSPAREASLAAGRRHPRHRRRVHAAGRRPGARGRGVRRVVPVIAALRGRGLRAADLDRHPQRRRGARRLRGGRRSLERRLGADPRPREPGARRRLGPAGLPDARAGRSATMQDAPAYEDVLLDVYDYLEARVAAAEAAGIPRARILVDPGIGFGKTMAHNLALIRGLALLHGLGCAHPVRRLAQALHRRARRRARPRRPGARARSRWRSRLCGRARR